jgi:hypothetical protein
VAGGRPLTDAAPAWLAPHLAPDERVVWRHDARRRLAPIGWTVFGLAVSAYYGGAWFLNVPGEWSWLAQAARVDVPRVPGALGLLVAFVGFAWTAVEPQLRREFTSFAVTDRRLVRLLALPGGRVESWPLAQVRARKRRRGSRVEARSPTGKRLARFRAPPGLAEALTPA